MSEFICPFCNGTEYRFRYHKYNEVKPYYVECKTCFAAGAFSNRQKEVLPKWAKRAELVQEGACPFCGTLDHVQMGVGDDDGDYMACYNCWSFGPKKPTAKEAEEAWTSATNK